MEQKEGQPHNENKLDKGGEENGKEKIKRKKKAENPLKNAKRNKRSTRNKRARRDGLIKCGSDVQLLIASFVAPKHLVSLSRTSSYWNRVLTSPVSAAVWTRAFVLLQDAGCDIEIDGDVIKHAREVMTLFTEKGCQLCAQPRIRKITWPFRKRVCQDCVKKNTISEYQLGTTFKVPQSKWSDMPSITRELWGGRHIGTFSLDFYWLTSVEKRLGMTVNEWQQLAEAAEKKRQEDTAASQAEFIRLLKSNPKWKPFSFITCLRKCSHFVTLFETRDPTLPWTLEEVSGKLQLIQPQFEVVHAEQINKRKKRKEEENQ